MVRALVYDNETRLIPSILSFLLGLNMSDDQVDSSRLSIPPPAALLNVTTEPTCFLLTLSLDVPCTRWFPLRLPGNVGRLVAIQIYYRFYGCTGGSRTVTMMLMSSPVDVMEEGFDARHVRVLRLVD
jgi:hypothetical protein